MKNEECRYQTRIPRQLLNLGSKLDVDPPRQCKRVFSSGSPFFTLPLFRRYRNFNESVVLKIEDAYGSLAAPAVEVPATLQLSEKRFFRIGSRFKALLTCGGRTQESREQQVFDHD